MRINKKDLKLEAMELLYEKYWLIFCKLSNRREFLETRTLVDWSCEIKSLKKKMIVEKRKILWMESVLGYTSLKETKA